MHINKVPDISQFNRWQLIGLCGGLAGLIILAYPFLTPALQPSGILLTLALFLLGGGIIAYTAGLYLSHPAGIKNNAVWFYSLTNRGVWAWITAGLLTGIYVLLYWFPRYLGYDTNGTNTGLVAMFDPLSLILNGRPATQWFVYGSLYTLAILFFGLKFIFKYRHNRYQILSTWSVIFFQLVFAFLLPEVLSRLHPEQAYFAKDLKNMWPLNYYFFEDWHLLAMLQGGNLGLFMLVAGLVMIFVISPILTYFFGKRWYCSWVCGCGGLAETAGDPFRQLSDKSSFAWRLEKWSIHLILVFITITTIAVIYAFLDQPADQYLLSKTQFVWGTVGLMALILSVVVIFKRQALSKKVLYLMIALGILIMGLLLFSHYTKTGQAFFIHSGTLKSWYGFFIGAAFSGVIGVGFYPLLGNRVWCRFGCPMAAILGLQQILFSRFRITTNGGQCISCGNCSAYCEMGIDVRAYAQQGQDIVRASCVGCGICSAVCPRGVLKLENGEVKMDQ